MDILGITMSGKKLHALHPQLSFQKDPRIWRLCNQCQQESPTFYYTQIVRHWSDDLWIHTAAVSLLLRRLEKRKQCENLSFVGSMDKGHFTVFLFSENQMETSLESMVPKKTERSSICEKGFKISWKTSQDYFDQKLQNSLSRRVILCGENDLNHTCSL